MACILKLPSRDSKGVLTFTTPERDMFIRRSGTLRGLTCKVKKNWLIGLHHNAAHADHNFTPDQVFDFHIAGPGDLSDPLGRRFIQIEMDCSNFCADFFQDPRVERRKFWDILFISRNVGFKSLGDLLQIARKLLNKRRTRILAIVTHSELHHKGVGSSEIIEKYMKMFNAEERKLFTLMTPSIDAPFPFDLETLAHFYHSSQVFLHVARDERHPRVVAYAWAGGLPVVAPAQVASLLPEGLQSPPGFWVYSSIDEAVSKIEHVLSDVPSQDAMASYVKHHLGVVSIPRFKEEIAKVYAKTGNSFVDGGWMLDSLDIRLARHHLREWHGNSTGQSLGELISFLDFVGSEAQFLVPTGSDCEVALAKIGYVADAAAMKRIERECLFHTLKSDWIGKVKSVALAVCNRFKRS